MRAWLLLLAVLATFKPFVQVAGTEDITTLISATISSRSVTSLYNPLIEGTDAATSRLAGPTVLLYDSSSDMLKGYESDENESANSQNNKKSDINKTNINTNNDDSNENAIIEIKSIEQKINSETTNAVPKSHNKKMSTIKQSKSLSHHNHHKPKQSYDFAKNNNEEIDVEKALLLKSESNIIETDPMQEQSSKEEITSRQTVFGESNKNDLSDLSDSAEMYAEIDSYDAPSSSSSSSEIPERILSNIPPPDFEFPNFDTATPDFTEDHHHNSRTFDVTVNEEEIELENNFINEVESIWPTQAPSSSPAPPVAAPSTPAPTQSQTSNVPTKKKSKRKSKKHHHNRNSDRDVHDSVITNENSATSNSDNSDHLDTDDANDILSQDTYSNKEKIGEKLKPDPSTLVQIENSLLSLFNMKRPPKIDRSKIIIPEAMKKLYAEIMGHDIDSVNIPKRGLLTKSANTVRSFTHLDSKIDQRFPHHHRFRLHFDIRTIPTEEKLKAAELQLSRDDISHALRKPHLANITRYQVLAYDITRVGIRGKREPTFLLLDNKTIRLNSTDTISLDVQPAVERWLVTPKKNYGLLIEVRTFGGLKPAPHHHVRLRRSADEPHENWQRKQPLLFTYTDDGRQKSRSIRDVSTRSKRAGHHRRPHRRKNNVEICRRQSLYVDFTDVGWSDWIVAPPGYDAYYCHGKCPFPLAEHLNSTNHAVVQTLVNNLNPGKVPNACCVPTQLTGISMLYLNDQSTVVLKNYQDMTVVGCGCR